MEMPFTVWIDADSCPVPIREIVTKFCLKRSITLIFVANHQIPVRKDNLIKMIISEATPDAADNYIVENAKENDIVITRDLPFAERLVDKNCITMNDRGVLFTHENIKEKRSIRDFNLSLFDYGIPAEKTSIFGEKEKKLFANCFDREIQKRIKLASNKDIK